MNEKLLGASVIYFLSAHKYCIKHLFKTTVHAVDPALIYNDKVCLLFGFENNYREPWMMMKEGRNWKLGRQRYLHKLLKAIIFYCIMVKYLL